jgi:hypothetical protein
VGAFGGFAAKSTHKTEIEAEPQELWHSPALNIDDKLDQMYDSMCEGQRF